MGAKSVSVNMGAKSVFSPGCQKCVSKYGCQKCGNKNVKTTRFFRVIFDNKNVNSQAKICSDDVLFIETLGIEIYPVSDLSGFFRVFSVLIIFLYRRLVLLERYDVMI